MEQMISKELLSAVLNVKVERIYCSGHWVVYWTLYKNGKEKRNQINTHELGNIVQEWAYSKKGYALRVYLDKNEWRAETGICDKPFYAQMAPEAIFKAGQWILESNQ